MPLYDHIGDEDNMTQLLKMAQTRYRRPRPRRSSFVQDRQYLAQQIYTYNSMLEYTEHLDDSEIEDIKEILRELNKKRLGK